MTFYEITGKDIKGSNSFTIPQLISYAENKMHHYKNLALKELENFPESSSKKAFIGLINYSINRKK